MKRELLTILVFNIFIFLILILSGCAGSAFKEAKGLNTIAAYSDFLKKYPNSEYTKEAESKKEELICKEIFQKNLIEEYEIYLKRYPNGKCFNDVEGKLDLLYWGKALQENSITAYTNYTNKFPSGRYTKEAKERKDRLFCEELREKGSYESYTIYLEQYPEGFCSIDIKQRLDPLAWKIAEKKDTLADYESYLQVFPTGRYVAEAENKRKIALLIQQIKSDTKDIRFEAINKLSNMGKDLSKSQVDKIIDIMRNGKEKWSEYLYRQSHCTWYEETNVRYYAASIIIKLKSPYIDTEIVNEAKMVRGNGKRKYRVNDPGWI